MIARGNLIAIFLLLISCSSELSDDPIPPVVFQDIVINLNLPEYNSLRTKGYQYLSGGVRGIILYKLSNSSVYYAFERNCSYQPNSACATVDMHSSGLYMMDSCCGSTFSSSGDPTGGPAWRSLRRYSVIFSGDLLTISDVVVE